MATIWSNNSLITVKLGPDQIAVNIKYNLLRSLDSDQIAIYNTVKPGPNQIAVNIIVEARNSTR